MEFKCPNKECDHGSVEKVDDRFFDSERIMSSDALNADPLSSIERKIELWYCCFCGCYFKAHYKLDKITMLSEKE